MASPQPIELLDTLDRWIDAQLKAESPCDPDPILRRKPKDVIFRVLVSAGPEFRTTCYVPAGRCRNVNNLLQTTWEAVQVKVAKHLPGELYKWWEGVVLVGNSSLEKKKSRRVKLVGTIAEHQKTWFEWRKRNIEEGYQRVYTVGVAFGVPEGQRRLPLLS